MKKAKPFSKLTKCEQRVEIAKDVIKQLKLKTLVPLSGTYVTPTVITQTDEDELQGQELDKLISEKKVTCQVCAKGALFISHVMKTDNCTLQESKCVGNGRISFRLNMFSQAQLDKIEQAFEGWGVENPKSKMSKFIRRWGTEEERLLPIMKNIIKNGGTFKP